MQLSALELSILYQIAHGNNTIDTIASTLHRDISRIYRAKQSLISKDLITFSQKTVYPQKKPLVNLLLQLLLDHPHLISLLADSGISILMLLLKKHSIQELQRYSSYKKSMIYLKIKQAKQKNIVKKINSSYQINDEIWPDLSQFLRELHTYEHIIDERVPAGSKIYTKNADMILFSNKRDLDASKTAFSAYNKYGITLFLSTNYYILPKQNLSEKQVFIHSLMLTERDKTIRNITFVALFYLKYRLILNDLDHPILSNIKEILKGKNISGYPTKETIMQKADVYDIQV